MNTDTGELRRLLIDEQERSGGDLAEARAEALDALNRAERRANGTGLWVEVSPKVAAVVRAGHAAMKAKKKRRRAADAARRRNR